MTQKGFHFYNEQWLEPDYLFIFHFFYFKVKFWVHAHLCLPFQSDGFGSWRTIVLSGMFHFCCQKVDRNFPLYHYNIHHGFTQAPHRKNSNILHFSAGEPHPHSIIHADTPCVADFLCWGGPTLSLSPTLLDQLCLIVGAALGVRRSGPSCSSSLTSPINTWLLLLHPARL